MVISEQMNEDATLSKLSEYHQQELLGYRKGGARRRVFDTEVDMVITSKIHDDSRPTQNIRALLPRVVTRNHNPNDEKEQQVGDPPALSCRQALSPGNARYNLGHEVPRGNIRHPVGTGPQTYYTQCHYLLREQVRVLPTQRTGSHSVYWARPRLIHAGGAGKDAVHASNGWSVCHRDLGG